MPVGTRVILRDEGFAMVWSPSQNKYVRICNNRQQEGYIAHSYKIETPKKVYWLYDVFSVKHGTLIARSMQEDEFSIMQEVA